jgi:hypothetical protein
MDLRDAQRRARQPFAEIRHVLAHQIPGRRDEADVTLLFEDGVDRHAQHDFGLARTRRRLEQKLEDIVVQAGAYRVDRGALVVRQRKCFAGLDKLMRDGDRLRIAVDRRPNLGI